ncbi:1074_t:CDS:2 [Racocetra fulgida]|uniref:1074_t:CDS:1 n=1 Tax=Racocetra fulgida TaxID=60492 RepID=A0A9N9FZB3_9GLOM|nr:1074_t:CDS:2 [Racocetra fulgida]
MDQKRAGDILTEIIEDLFSYDEDRYKHVLETYFVENAKLSHPLLNVEGTHNIRKVFRVWTSLNCIPPEVADVPKEDGLFYIEKQEDNWTLEGLIQSVPLINWWYDCVVRVVVGDLVARAGSFLATANQATSHLAVKANEIRDNGHSAIAQGQNTAKEYLNPIHTYITHGYSKGQEFVDQAKTSVKNKFSQFGGTQTNGNIPDYARYYYNPY